MKLLIIPLAIITGILRAPALVYAAVVGGFQYIITRLVGVVVLILLIMSLVEYGPIAAAVAPMVMWMDREELSGNVDSESINYHVDEFYYTLPALEMSRILTELGRIQKGQVDYNDSIIAVGKLNDTKEKYTAHSDINEIKYPFIDKYIGLIQKVWWIILATPLGVFFQDVIIRVCAKLRL